MVILQNLLEGDGLASAVLDSLPDATAVLDGVGTIVAVNRTWMMFALDNGGLTGAIGVGQNYLSVCERSAQGGCTDPIEWLKACELSWHAKPLNTNSSIRARHQQ
jgi:hypothetical protein